MEEIERLEQYARTQGNDRVDRSFFYWDPGTYTYLFVPTRRALSVIADRISGSSPTRRAGSAVFRGLASVPWLCHLVPGLSTYDLSVPLSHEFELVIAGTRIKAFDFDENVVATMSADDDDFREIIELRRSLPDGINAPVIYEYDESFPYYTEELITGRELLDPVEEWHHIRGALEQLRPLYTRDAEWQPIESAKQDIREMLDETGILNDSLIQRALSTLRELSLPDGITIGTVHGDFHTGNLLVSDGDVYILDWDRSRRLPVVADFVKLFHGLYIQSGQIEPFIDLLNGEGKAWEMYTEYLSALGTAVYQSEQPHRGVPLFHLLYTLGQDETRTSAPGSATYELIEKALPHVQTEISSRSG